MMEIPIQVAVQIYPGFPNEPCCVQTIPAGTGAGTGQQLYQQQNNAIGLNSTATDGSIPTPTSTGLVQIKGHSYPATHALPYDCSLETSYRQTVQPMLVMFLEGFDISIVTYGQHACGKTYTLLGPGLDCIYGERDHGIVQRITRDIYGRLAQSQYCNRNFCINFRWIEICGEEIHDILGGRNVQCREINDVFQLLKIGLTNRSQEASHSLITITLEQQWINADGLIQHRLSTVSFCDLCATERMLAVNNRDQRISIPKDHGLQMLERIVSILSDPTSSIMHNSNMNLLNLYEQTTLTKLLRDSFGGRAQTLLFVCVSPLEQNIPETTNNLQFAYKVQLIRNSVMMNTYSDNNMPLTNVIYSQRIPIDALQLLGGGGGGGESIESEDILGEGCDDGGIVSDIIGNNSSTIGIGTALSDPFNLKFAASQWQKLVSNAEGVFSTLLLNSKSLHEQDRERIEEWMFLKQECEECLSSNEFIPNPHRLLGPIPEIDEPDETTTSEATSPIMMDDISCQKQKYNKAHRVDDNDGDIIGDGSDGVNLRDSTTTDNDSDFEDIMQQSQYLEERLADAMVSFTIKTDDLIHKHFFDFLKTYPEAIYESIDETTTFNGGNNFNRRNNVNNNNTNDSNNEKEIDETVIKPQRRGSLITIVLPTSHTHNNISPGGGMPTGRRRSIQGAFGDAGGIDNSAQYAGGALNLSSADIAHLNRLAESSEQERLALNEKPSSYLLEAENFLESSTEIHPLRIVQSSKPIEKKQNHIYKLRIDLTAKKNQIIELKKTIEAKQKLFDELNRKDDARKNAKRKFQQKNKNLLSAKETLQLSKEKLEKKLKERVASERDKAEIELINRQIEKVNQRLNDLVQTKQITAENSNRITEVEQSIRESKEELKTMEKKIKDDRKTIKRLESNLKLEQLKEIKAEKVTGSIAPAASASNGSPVNSSMTNEAGCIDARITNLDCVLKEKTENLRQNAGEIDKEQSLRHEVRNLRSERERLLQGRYQLDDKLKTKNLSDREVRKILAVDVLIEVIDSVIEFKNELLCGRHGNTSENGVCLSNPGSIVDRMSSVRNKIGGDQQLMAQLNKLSDKEMRTLLYKCLQKIIDLRASSSQLENQVINKFLHEYCLIQL